MAEKPRKSDATSDTKEDAVSFGKILLEKGLATPEQVQECMRIILQSSTDERGRVLRLGDVMMRKGYIRLDDVEVAMKEQASRTPATSAITAATLAVSPKLPPDVAKVMTDVKRRLGKYVLMREIGRGGMGAVYRSWDTALNRYIALKVLTADSAGDITRFLREAQTAASLSHPNITAIYDVGEQEGKYFIAMNYIEGRNAADHKETPKRAAEIIRKAAEALDYAHKEKVVHRDIKPQNIMLDREGKVFVMDFGIARSKGQSHLTAAGTALGTPSYMSPEQAQGLEITRLSDIYSLGATLYELVTGRAPHKGKTPLQTIMLVLNREPATPRSINPSIPEAMELIVQKAMDKDPRSRYQTAQALADDLDRFMKGDPILAQPPTVFTTISKKFRRHKMSLAIAAVGLLVMTVVLMGVLSSNGNAEKFKEAVGKADRLFDSGKFTEALAFYNQATGLNEADERVKKRIAECKKKADATIAADRLAKEEAERRRKEIEEREKLLAEAGPEIERGKAILEQAERDLYRPGADLTASRMKAGEAIIHFGVALAKVPKHPDALYYRGRARLLRLEYEIAESDFSLAIDASPTSTAPLVARGKLHIRRWIDNYLDCGGGQYSKEDPALLRERKAATADFTAAAKAGQREKQDAFDAMVHFAEGDMFNCIAMCDRILARGDTDEEIHKMRGDALFFGMQVETTGSYAENTAQRMRESISSYDRAIALRTNFPEARAMRGYVKNILGKTDEARADLNEAVRCDPRNFLALVATANTISHSGTVADFERANALYTDAIAIKPDTYYARTNRGTNLTFLSQFDPAMKDFDEAIALRPEHPWAYQAKGGLLGKLQRYQEADAVLTLSIAKNATVAVTWYNRGAVRANLGRNKEAIADFEEAIRLGHTNAAEIRRYIEDCRKR